MERRYVVYLRVSTEEQAEKGYSLEAMLEKCQHYIKSQENATLVKVYEDRGFSGSIPPRRRPALNQLLEDIKNRDINFNTVLVWKLDRMGRCIRDVLNMEHMLSKANKTIESCTERIDTSSVAGKMLFNLLASFSEFEAGQTSDRTFTAMSCKVGSVFLGGKPPIGYQRYGERLVCDPKTIHIVRYIFEQFLSLKNYSKVAEVLNKKGFLTSANARWSHNKIQRILSNPVYIGVTAWCKKKRRYGRSNPDKWIIKEHTHEPIVTQETFKKAQNIIEAVRSRTRRYSTGDRNN